MGGQNIRLLKASYWLGDVNFLHFPFTMYYTLTIATLKICMYFCFIHFLITILMVLFLYFQFSEIRFQSLIAWPFFSVQSTSGIFEVCHGTAHTRSEVGPSRARIQGVCNKGRRKFNRSSKTIGSPLNGWGWCYKRSSTGKPAGPIWWHPKLALLGCLLYYLS